MALTLEEIVRRFDKPRRQSDGSYKCLCPCHPDKEPSLSISKGDIPGKIIFKCFAGCEMRDIIEKVGLTMKDISEGKGSDNDLDGMEARYDYRDESGKYLYSKIRHRDKRMYIGQVQSNGNITKGMGGEKATLYRLPELIEAVTKKKVIYFSEGEKDADTLTRLGYNATTSGSATSWKKAFTKYFEGAAVVLLPDNDNPGREFIEKVEKDMRGVCSRYKIIPTSMANGGDITDYISEGNTKEDFDRLVEAIPWIMSQAVELKPKRSDPGFLQCYTAQELGVMDLKPPDFIVNDLLPVGVAILAAPSKIGKSWLAMDLSMSVAEGKTFLGYETNQSEVFYLALEDSLYRLRSRMDKLAQGGKPAGLFTAVQSENMINGFMDQLETFLKEHPGVKLIIVDTLQKVKPPSEKYGTAYEQDYRLLSQFKDIAASYNIGVLLIHHTRKANGFDGDVFEKILGSTALQGATDTMFVLSKGKRTDEVATLTATGRDIYQQELIVRFDKDSCRWINEGSVDEIEQRITTQNYESDPIVMTIRSGLLKDEDFWEGSLDDLRMAVSSYTRQVMPETGKALSAKVTKLSPLLASMDNIEHRTGDHPVKRNGKSVRLHSFQRYHALYI